VLKKSKFLLSTIAIAFSVFALNFSSPASAEVKEKSKWVDSNNDGLVDKEKLSKEEKEKFDKRAAEIDAYFAKIAELKSKINALENRIKTEDDENLSKELATLQDELYDLENNTEKNIGLKKVGKTNPNSGLVATAASTASDLTMSGTIYFDVFNPSQWVARGDWDWKNSNWANDRSGSGDVGKLDAFAVILDEDIDIYSYKLRTYWSYSGKESTPGTVYNDKSEADNGWGWKWQDKISYDQTSTGGSVKTYNSGSGIATIYFKFENPNTGSGDTVEISTEYAHTWSSTNVDNISFSLTDISFSFSSSSARWSDEGNWPIEL
jgi:hypothetical protein